MPLGIVHKQAHPVAACEVYWVTCAFSAYHLYGVPMPRFAALPAIFTRDMKLHGHLATCLIKHFGDHSWLTALALLQQVSGDEGAEAGQRAAGGKIQAYWQVDGEDEELHMEDSM